MTHIDASKAGTAPLCSVFFRRLPILAWLLISLVSMSNLALAQANEQGNEQDDERNDASASEPVAVGEQEPLVVSYEDYNDPLEPVNRVFFRFNDYVYRYALIPAAKGYTKAVPGSVRQSVGNAYDNIREPLNSINHLLQGEPAPAGRNLLRFVTNSTIGIFGLFDPAANWLGIEPDEARLGDTLASYNLGYGVYLVLPFIGTTDVRSGLSSLVETTIHPVRYLLDDTEASYILIFDSFQRFAPQADAYLTLYDESDDPYLMFRNQYLQGVMRDDEFGSPATGDDDE